MAQSRRDTPPLVPPGYTSSYPEVTLLAVIFAIMIGVVMNAAITYAGLKIGFTIGGSAIAAVLGFGVLRGLLRRGTILETNIVQTVASAVNTSNSGIIFTVPVLLLVGHELSLGEWDFWLITLAGVAGAYLGTAFIIPLRKQMIDIERLRFPSPTGVATILKSPGAGPAKATVLVIGMILGAAIYLPAGLPAITQNADVADLQSLVDREKISEADMERTQLIDGWITAGRAPDDLIEMGRIVDELTEAREDSKTHAQKLARAVERNREASVIEPMSQELVQRRQRVEELENALSETVVATPIATHDLARAAYKAETSGDWEQLRDPKVGWATMPLFGYSDLEVRLPWISELDEEVPEAQRGEVPLSVRVDRDGNSQPDLVVTDSTVDVGRILGLPDEFQLIFAIAPFALGAGFITGRAGLFVLAGGILAFFVLNPIAYRYGWMPATVEAYEAPGFAFGAFNRPLGIGLLLGGALMGVLASMPAIREAMKSIIFSRRGKGVGGRDEFGFAPIVVVVALGLGVLCVASYFMDAKPFNQACPITAEEVDMTVETVRHDGYTIGFATDEARADWADLGEDAQTEWLLEQNAKAGWFAAMAPLLKAILIAIIGAAWIWFAGIIIAQCAGMTDWSPISGLALLTVVLIMLLAGTGSVVAAVLIGAALCVAITLAADMMGDLKTGYLVGSVPRKQQGVELIVVGIGPIVCMLFLWIIVQANLKQGDAPIGPGTATVAPQAQALQAVVTGVQGGEMPYMLYGIGALVGALLGLGAFSGLGVLVGLSMYLPFMYIATYGIGCIINIVMGWVASIFVGKSRGKRWTEEWGVPLAAGLIVGESILALLLNLYLVLFG